MTRRWQWLPLLALTACAVAQEPASPPAVDIDALSARARAAEAGGDREAAAAFYLELTAAQPARAEWVLAAARCLRDAGRFNDAFRVLLEGEARLPDDLELPATRASIFHVKAETQQREGVPGGDLAYLFEEAADLASSVLERDPNQRAARLIRAQSHFQLGRLDDALADAAEATSRFPDHPGGPLLAGKVHYYRFITRYRQRAELPERSQEWVDCLQEAADERTAAQAAFTKAIELDANRADPHVQLGNIYGELGNVEQALVAFGNALAIDPECAVNHGWVAEMARAARRMQLYSEAAATYRKRADARAERLTTLDWWSGRALFDEGQFAEALPLFERAAADPRWLRAHHLAMLCAQALGKLDEAQAHAQAFASAATQQFADAIKAEPNPAKTIEVLQALADRSFEGQRFADSRDINHVLALATDKAEHWNNYAFLCRETRRFEEAWIGYQRALALEPDSPRLLNDAAVILQYHLVSPENRELARGMYERAIEAADAILRDRTAKAEKKKDARSAKDDARGNLAKLGSRIP